MQKATFIKELPGGNKVYRAESGLLVYTTSGLWYHCDMQGTALKRADCQKYELQAPE